MEQEVCWRWVKKVGSGILKVAETERNWEQCCNMVHHFAIQIQEPIWKGQPGSRFSFGILRV